MPDTYHGVYYWNGGVFPYVIKPELRRVILVNGDEVLPMMIKEATPKVGTRFRFDHANRCSVADPDGDSCIWELHLTLQKER